MAGAYIVYADITNKLFSRQTDAAKDIYLAHANEEIEDFAIRLGAVVADIVDPIHYKIKRYAVNYALSLFAEDNVGLNQETPDTDVYQDLFKRSQYLMQETRPDVTLVMFTGGEQTPNNRSVRSIRLVRV